jgi:putative endopeptidase
MTDIETARWMSPATKEQAIVKLKGILDKIGYPSQWRDYSSVQITRASYLANVEEATSFEFERWVAKIGKPVDRSEWGMTPPTINAYLRCANEHYQLSCRHSAAALLR